jgi:hypothetical protein
MKPDDRPLFVALLAVAFAGFAIAGSTLVKEPVELNWDTVWVGVTGLFTVVLAVSTILLWKATKAAGDRADSVIRTAERAYVKMSHAPPGLRPVPGMDGMYLIEVVITNYGRTPATVTDAMIKAYVIPNEAELPPEPNYTPDPGPQEQPKAFLVTNDMFQYVRRWKVNAKISLPDPTHVLFAIGYVEYTDAFGRRYRSGYARLYKPKRDYWDPVIYPTEESFRTRSNLVFVTQEGYNYDVPLDDERDDVM